ncbi:MAG TPA: DNA methyltransferase [Thermoanaerobaculia bacterium]|nr:DNA methyltransferase [Thermoanaerobaculia bacterium]
MNILEFVQKWSQVALNERSASQQHFLDLCEVFGHPKPAAADPKGEWFTFERGASKHGGGGGWADVWKRGFFGWEYKGRHKDLDAAYDQLLKYREALENPPLLVVCDMDRIVVHTNFTGTRTEIHDIPLAKLGEPGNLDILRAVFDAPLKLKPGVTNESITQEAASRVAAIAQSMRSRGLDPHEVARFLDRLVFALFAEDVGLLPAELFSRLVRQSRRNPELFRRFTTELFQAMAVGDYWALDRIRHFNGNLFNETPVLTLTIEELASITEAAKLDWSAVDPSIFGTLFERGLDPGSRSQLGAHYTSREDIETLVEPVVMQPLRREWSEVQRLVENLLATGKKAPTGKEKLPLQGPAIKKARVEADLLIRRFWERLGQIKVLDPACGSGNFLYVTLQKLKDLEKEVIIYAMACGFPAFIPHVGPWQLHGIEINPYAFELAQMSIWIGYLQWIKLNGFGEPEDPVLRPMDTFECKDAILDLSDPENPKEPEWPKVEFIVGNPPFQGGKKMRRELGDEYLDALFKVWEDRVPAEADLCSYWFEKARQQIEDGFCSRTGLLATQAIRGGANREVLHRIRETGDIFFAVSDREWILEGAAVHVSLVGFDDGGEEEKQLDGVRVNQIYANLRASANTAAASPLSTNLGFCFMGDTKGGLFEVAFPQAWEMLQQPNPHGRPNSDVLRPWINGRDLTQRSRDYFIIDFGVSSAESVAALYEAPYSLAQRMVRPLRLSNRRESYREVWWRHVEARPSMLAAIRPLNRFLCTPRVTKHRLFVWSRSPTLPDSQVFVFARSDDYFFGVLHSRLHEGWSLVQGTQVRERESGFRYTPGTCFETFPFPEPTPDQQEAVAGAAKELDDLRNRWLNPPEWTREEVLEFPGSADGPWARYVHDPDERGIGTVRYPRLIPKDEKAAEQLRLRTLTNLYNQRPTWLDLAHRKLDETIFAAYGWSPDLSDEEILGKLLELNLARTGQPK